MVTTARMRCTSKNGADETTQPPDHDYEKTEKEKTVDDAGEEQAMTASCKIDEKPK